MSIDLKKFESRLQSYVRKYPYCETDPYDFDEFWRWKLETEAKGKSILDLEHRRDTYEKLSKALPKWRTYRPHRGRFGRSGKEVWKRSRNLGQKLDELPESSEINSLPTQA